MTRNQPILPLLLLTAVALAGCDEQLPAFVDADAYRRCLETPAVPGIDWPEDLVRATCRSAAESLVDPEETRTAIESGNVAALEARLDEMWRDVLAGRRHERSVQESIEAFNWPGSEAESLATRWVELAPDSAFAHAARGTARLAQAMTARGEASIDDLPPGALERMRSSLELAAVDFTASRRLRPDFSIPYTGLISIARLSADRAMLDTLRADIDKYVPNSYFARAALLLASEPRWGGSIEGMRATAEAAQKADDPMMRVLLGQDVAYAGMDAWWRKDYATALAAFEDGMRRGGPSFFYIDLASYAAFALQQQDRALAWGDQLVRFAPGYEQGYSDRARVLYARKDWNAALADADRLLARQPNNPRAQVVAGDALRGLGRDSEAADRYQRALQADPHNPSALRGAAEHFIYAEKRPADAIPLLLRRLEDAPGDGDALVTMVLALFEARDLRIYAYIDRLLAAADPSVERQRTGIEQARHFLAEHPRPEPFDETAPGTW